VTKLKKFLYGFFALGWTGSNRHWSNYEKAYLILAGLSTPLVLSVHSVVSFDFAVSQVPGWHTTIFPPYFVAGAIFSGFGMVLTLLIPLRRSASWRTSSRPAHRVDVQGDPGDRFDRWLRLRHGVLHRLVRRESLRAVRVQEPRVRTLLVGVLDNDHLQRDQPAPVLVQVVRTKMWFVWFAVSIVVNIGMWFERFVIIVTSLHRDYLPSSWGYFTPPGWTSDLRGQLRAVLHVVPAVHAIPADHRHREVKAVTPQADPHHPLGGAKSGGAH
jgi:hypothetical protein